ncbi:DNA gyrase/topoisomerase IV subunit A [Cellulomonas marina]|uniref:DNA topoisomerase (ATP-hydrolyzing) n=1 Tax=Cellulomonas marina TaxID=988821 RepID=A0A1I0W1L0_9CELL|nr:DNA topoisomerase IV subunit A [Cellulomonas marina]GIG27401.1 DNA topoisomerase (ATP-hydrolyzing) [Cellulomonas marina]SFA82491.1 DNA gyrase subunit A [Cellulomonas marina]
MARRPSSPDVPPPDVAERIVDIDVAAEMEASFLEYAYSVIYTRALPDARDGLKPVQRRILFQMSEMGLRPDRPYVKSARVVGDVMGKLHPHGDAAIYDAMVRLAQPFSLRLPLIDGHGNFGSLDDGPAAPRYTEARMAPAATAMTRDLDEDTVDFVPNYDNRLQQPAVLPSAIPNLLVNGASGIAVGMATNMVPHNLVEVVAAARHLIAHPAATLEDLLRFVPGPDLPTGGKIVGLDGVREAYRTGRGQFRTRATARIENVTARRQGIVVTELPYLVGPEKVREKIKEGVQSKRLQGIASFDDHTDRTHGVRLVIEVKSGFHPEAVLEQLYRYTPLEDAFSVNSVVLVEGQPRTLGLRELLQVWVDHRIDVVRRRSEHRLAQRKDRAHLVAGLLVAILDIDEVIQVIRSAEDAETARTRLRQVFDLSEPQAEYILELRLRRLTRFSVLELEAERDRLAAEIAELEEVLGDDQLLRELVSDEMAEVAQTYGTPRRTVLLEHAGGSAVGATAAAAARGRGRAPAAPLEIADTPCWALLSATGLLARTPDAEAPPRPDPAHRARHDVLAGGVLATARGHVGAVTSAGRVVRVPVLDLPALAPAAGAPSLSGGVPLAEVVPLERGERVVGLCALGADAPTLTLATAGGVVKRVASADVPANRDAWEVIGLKPGDEVVGAVEARDDDELVLVSSDASLLRFAASAVRPQGRPAGGMAGIALAAGARVVALAAVPPGTEAQVVTVAGSSSALPGTQAGSAKVTPFAVFPAKGRATGGVRSHRFLRGEDALLLAWVGPAPALAVAAGGQAVDLPGVDVRRDGSGTPLAAPVHAVG